MAKTVPKTVPDYIASRPDNTQAALTRVRRAIQKALPAAEEVISYAIPAYKVHGRVTIYFAGWKEHFSIYPVSAPLVAAFKQELAAYTVRKGTIRFPLAEPVPSALIGRIAKFMARQTAERIKSKSSAAKKR